MRKILIAGLTLALSAASAHAQAPNAIVENYRAYMAALERNDLAAAEAAAAAALDASVTRDGDGGRTGVLALNLAVVRLNLGKPAEAHDPAARALSIATSRENSAVDPLMARLALGQAELAVGDGAAGRDRLTAAIPEAEGKEDLAERLIAGASALGAWAYSKEDFVAARSAYATAARAAAGDDPILVYLRARAQTGEAASILMIENSHRPVDRAQGEAAYALLFEAARAIQPLAFQEAGDGGLTPPQRAYAEALAWRSVIRTVFDLSFDNSLVVANACKLKSDRPMDFAHYYPSVAADRGMSAVVVLRLKFDAQGRRISTDVAAAAPEEYFPRATQRMANDADFRADMSDPAGCVVQRVYFMPITFRIGR